MPKLREYQVTIPYYHVFIVEATSKRDAIRKAHQTTGEIVGYDDSKAEVEEGPLVEEE